MILLDKQTANISTGQKTHRLVRPSGGPTQVFASGTFDGATVGIEIMPPSGQNWIRLTDADMTEAGGVILNGVNSTVRGVLESAGASTEITLEIS